MPKRHAWSTRFGFYLVAIGSASGLGNLWRFPYIVGENGGGAFVLLYFLLTITVGLPLLIGELLLGKTQGQSVVLSTKKLVLKSGLSFKWVGRLSIIVSLAVFSYYAVISGWVLHFLMQFTVGLLSGPGINPDLVLSSLMDNGLLQIALASVHVLFVVIISNKGIQEGLEKWVGFMMPLFFFLLLLLMGRTLSLPSAEEALRFLFYPDFSKLTWGSPLAALGHVFFTLSVGFGTMVTFGSYLKKDDHVPSAGARVAFADTSISILAGLLIFPIVLASSSSSMSDPTLLFDSLPQFFSSIPGGYFFAILFFLCLYLAALGASMGLFEVIVVNIVETFKNINRPKAIWMTALVSLIVSITPALSSTQFRYLKINGKSLLEFLDNALISLVLPLIGFFLCLGIGRVLSKELQRKEFEGKDHLNSSAIFEQWHWSLQWWAPLVIFFSFLMWTIGFFLEISA